MALRGLSVVIELGLVTMVILYALIILGLGILGTRAIVLFSDWNFEPGHCRVHLGISDTKVLLLDNLRRRVILGYADPAPLQNHQHGNPTTTNGRPTREIVLV